VLDFTLLLNPALKFVMLTWKIAVCILRIATQKMFKLLIATVRQAKLESGLPQAGIGRRFIFGMRAGVGNPQCVANLYHVGPVI
jgi:hypothetical protein